MAHGFNAPGVVEPFGIFSSAAWQPEGRVLHVSGHVAQSAGGTMADIAKVTVFVTDVAHVAAIHEVRAEFFAPPYPASTLVQVAALIDPRWLIEIEAVAAIPADRARSPA